MSDQSSAGVRNNQSGWPRFYHRWSITNSITAFVITVAFLIISSTPVSLLLVIVFVGSGLTVLVIGGRSIGRVFGLSNAITAIRSIAATGLLVWLLALEIAGFGVGISQMWTITLVLVFAELSDLFDGYVARRLGPTWFGAVWDMENDVAFSFVLCILAYEYAGLGSWILVSALIRHGYYLAFRFQSDPVRCPGAYKWFAKTVCAFQMMALIGAFIPFLPMWFKVAINILAIFLLFVSFGWDLLLRKPTVL